MEKSYPYTDRKFLSDREIVEAFTAAILPFSVEEIAVKADATPSSVKNWRAESNAPGFTKAMRLARRVENVQRAVLEIVGGNDPHKNRLLGVLYFHLAEIAAGSDELSAKKARKALQQFQEMKA